ncbi:hypothetical protein ACHAXT_007831 [Thalassiosira profunda]
MGRHHGTPASPDASKSVDSVTTEAILAKLAKAKEIESNLESMAAEQKSKRGSSRAASDEKCQAVRLQLCEALSDVILNDPALAEIMKEKSRAKKRQFSGGEAGESKKRLGEYDRQLKQFLKEAIQLYEYIIERYKKELSPLSQTQMTAASEMSQGQEEERANVIVASLFRMHIHLGDLYRYSTSYKAADHKMLAVVAQQSQESLTAVALYYYARSLMASRQPFETSRSNLARLFESNRKWIEEHSRDDDHHSRGILNVSDMDKKGNAAVGTSFGVSPSMAEMPTRVRSTWTGLMRKMASLVETFGNLVSNASFGEALLCKLVAALAFSTLGASNSGKLINSDGFLCSEAEGSHLERRGHHRNESGAGLLVLAASLGTIRSLPPLLLGCHFATSMYDGCEWFHGLPFYPTDDAESAGLEGNSIRKLCTDSHAAFWRAVARAANRLEGLPRKKRGGQESSLADVKEFGEFHGFVPFAPFLDASNESDAQMDHKAKEMKYASADDANSVLSEGKPSGGGSKGGADAGTYMKIELFLSFVHERTRQSGAGSDDECFLIKNGDTDELEYIGSDTESGGKVLSPRQEEGKLTSPLASPAIAEMDVEDPAVPATATATTGDAAPTQMPLLTPAALLASAGAANDAASTNTGDKEGADALLDLAALASKQPEPAQKASLPPPPGFSAPHPQPPQPQLAPLAPTAGGIFQPPNTTFGSNMQAMGPTAGSMLPQGMIPTTMNPFAQDPSESILNFLFDSNHDASENRQPLYPGQQQPPTKNPFAT